VRARHLWAAMIVVATAVGGLTVVGPALATGWDRRGGGHDAR
jgi:hypothetical protein